MKMNILIHELKYYLRSTILWTVSLVGIAILYLLIYPSFLESAEEFKKYISAYPKSVQLALGMSIDSFSGLAGFYSFVFCYITLCGAIQAMNLGVSVVSKETRQKTADFLLTKPVRRAQILTSKLLAILFLIIVTNIIYIIVSSIFADFVSDNSFNLKILTLISLTMFFIQLIFLTLGTMISVLFTKIKSVISVSLGTVFTFFILNMLESSIGNLSLRYLIPFKYYDPKFIINNGSYEISSIIIESLVIIVFIVSTYLIYIKKDIHAV